MRGRGLLGWHLDCMLVGKEGAGEEGRRTDCAGVGLHGGVEVGEEVDDIGLCVALLDDWGGDG